MNTFTLTNEFEAGMFQFPSNGKVYSETIVDMETGIKQECFNSLPTGKCIQRWHAYLHYSPSSVVSIPFQRESVFRVWVDPRVVTNGFQFPSNGKVYSEAELRRDGYVRKKVVSIPFKRESVFREETIGVEFVP